MQNKKQDKENAVFNMDCIAGMKSIKDESVDLVITDPPFAIDFKAKRGNYNRKSKNVLEGYIEIKQADYLAFSSDWIDQAHRVLKESGSMFVFSGWNNLKDVLIALDDAGFELVNHIIWKYQFGAVARNRYISSHYHCIYVCKDDKKRKFYADSRFKAGRALVNLRDISRNFSVL